MEQHSQLKERLVTPKSVHPKSGTPRTILAENLPKLDMAT